MEKVFRHTTKLDGKWVDVYDVHQSGGQKYQDTMPHKHAACSESESRSYSSTPRGIENEAATGGTVHQEICTCGKVRDVIRNGRHVAKNKWHD